MNLLETFRLIDSRDLKDQITPATALQELAATKLSAFVQVIKGHIPRLKSSGWTQEMIKQIDEQHGSLL